MNPVRSLIAALVLVLSGMGTWVWKINQDVAAAKADLSKAEEKRLKELDLKDQQAQHALKLQQEEHQKDLVKQNEEFEKKLDDLRKQERKRMTAAFEQFGGLLEGNKKTLDYINLLEQKVKSGQAISKNEAEKLAVVATGLGYLQKQYAKPFEQFSELEGYLSKRANANVESPNMNHSFWKRIFNSEFREQEREFYRSEGERRGFQEAQSKFSSAYASAQKQMGNVTLQTDKLITGLNDLIEEKNQNAPDLTDFFNQARKALNTHQKLLEFEPDATKPVVETPRP